MILPMTNDDRIELFDDLFVDWLGGETVYKLLVTTHHVKSVREAARVHGLPESTARTWINAARTKLRRLGFDADAIVGHAPEGVPLGSSSPR